MSMFSALKPKPRDPKNEVQISQKDKNPRSRRDSNPRPSGKEAGSLFAALQRLPLLREKLNYLAFILPIFFSQDKLS